MQLAARLLETGGIRCSPLPGLLARPSTCKLPRRSGFLCATVSLHTYHVPYDAPCIHFCANRTAQVCKSMCRWRAKLSNIAEQSAGGALLRTQPSARSRSTEEVLSWLSIFAAWFLGRCLCKDTFADFHACLKLPFATGDCVSLQAKNPSTSMTRFEYSIRCREGYVLLC